MVVAMVRGAIYPAQPAGWDVVVRPYDGMQEPDAEVRIQKRVALHPEKGDVSLDAGVVGK